MNTLRPSMITRPEQDSGGPIKRNPRAFNFGFRNAATGQFNSGQPIPSPRAMQGAYPRVDGAGVRGAGTSTDLRTILAAAGTKPVKSHPKLLGPAAKSESENIAQTIKRFLVERAAKGAPRL